MFLYIALIILVIWLGLITYYLRRSMHHYQTLTHGVNKKTLEDVLANMTRDLHIAKKDIDQLINRCDTIEKRQQFHIQKIGLLRFNPFKDTGGDQSFILALLDAKDTGVVITALYSRSGTRWYAKKVAKGKGLEHELSEEETKVIKIAREESSI
jgi:hypothetical protein